MDGVCCIHCMEIGEDIDIGVGVSVVKARQRLSIRKSMPIPRRTSSLSDFRWMCELMEEGNDSRFFEQMRMEKLEFIRFIGILKDHCRLGSCGKLDPLESIWMFIKIVPAGFSYTDVGERFQHLGETVSRHFHHVLNCICTFGDIMIAPINPMFDEIPYQISSDPRFSPYFDGCIGAIDGTHMQLRIPDGTQTVAWVDRHGLHSTNILVVVDFDMCVTFADVGKESSMHDARLLMKDMRSASRPFPFPPIGKYYLVDSGFPEMLDFLMPYKDVRYHLPSFREAKKVRTPDENFNLSHASLRSVVERTFGVIKNKWRILHQMSTYDLETQIKIVWTYFGLHNLCRRMLNDHFDTIFEYLLRTKYLRVPNHRNRGNPLRPKHVAHGEGVMHNIRDTTKDLIPFGPQ